MNMMVVTAVPTNNAMKVETAVIARDRNFNGTRIAFQQEAKRAPAASGTDEKPQGLQGVIGINARGKGAIRSLRQNPDFDNKTLVASATENTLLPPRAVWHADGTQKTYKEMKATLREHYAFTKVPHLDIARLSKEDREKLKEFHIDVTLTKVIVDIPGSDMQLKSRHVSMPVDFGKDLTEEARSSKEFIAKEQADKDKFEIEHGFEPSYFNISTDGKYFAKHSDRTGVIDDADPHRALDPNGVHRKTHLTDSQTAALWEVLPNLIELPGDESIEKTRDILANQDIQSLDDHLGFPKPTPDMLAIKESSAYARRDIPDTIQKKIGLGTKAYVIECDTETLLENMEVYSLSSLSKVKLERKSLDSFDDNKRATYFLGKNDQDQEVIVVATTVGAAYHKHICAGLRQIFEEEGHNSQQNIKSIRCPSYRESFFKQKELKNFSEPGDILVAGYAKNVRQSMAKQVSMELLSEASSSDGTAVSTRYKMSNGEVLNFLDWNAPHWGSNLNYQVQIGIDEGVKKLVLALKAGTLMHFKSFISPNKFVNFDNKKIVEIDNPCSTGVSLVTLDTPFQETHVAVKEMRESGGEAVDCEGFHLASLASKNNVAFLPFYFPSDHVGTEENIGSGSPFNLSDSTTEQYERFRAGHIDKISNALIEHHGWTARSS